MFAHSPTKHLHRTDVYGFFLADPKRNPVLYLEDEDAGATRFFLERGIPKSKLVPVNYSAKACAAIESQTGVQALHTDILEHLRTSSSSHSVIWLDLQCRSVPCDALRSAFRAAPYVIITLATRGMSPAQVLREGVEAVRKCGGLVLEKAPYVGASGRMNMLKIVAMSEKRTIETTKKKIQKKEIQAKKKKTMVMPPAARRLVGSTVYMPCSQWSDPKTLAYYHKHIKHRAGRFTFRVTKTYYHHRLVVHAVQQNNKLYRHPEPWTLTPEQVVQYSRG